MYFFVPGDNYNDTGFLPDYCFNPADNPPIDFPVTLFEQTLSIEDNLPFRAPLDSPLVKKFKDVVDKEDYETALFEWNLINLN